MNKLFLILSYLICSLFLLLGIREFYFLFNEEKGSLRVNPFTISSGILLILLSLVIFVLIHKIFKKVNSEEVSQKTSSNKFKNSMKSLTLLITVFVALFLISILLGLTGYIL